MALNIDVPLTTVGDLMEGFGLLSPISPLSVDCRGFAAPGNHGKKQLVSPVGSESSGVSSLDSDEIKKPTSPPSTPTEEVEEQTSSLQRPVSARSDVLVVQESVSKSSGCSSIRSSLSSTDSIGSSTDEAGINNDLLEPVSPKAISVVLGGRDALNLMDNLTNPNYLPLQFAQLPENDNIHFFLDNRSQYHRLGANGHIQEYTLTSCECCDFRYPIIGASSANGRQTENVGRNALLAAFQQMQQQQLQWNSFTNNVNSIASSRDKLNPNVSTNAFNKAFGGNNSGATAANNSNGSQYFRNGNMAGSFFGRDSNRNSGGNFLNSTNTYNNHKPYQQNFGAPNNNSNSKFNAPYGTYQLQPQQQQQQQYYSKNHQMRYSNGNGSGNGQSAASSGTLNSSLQLAAAFAQNFTNFNSSANYNSKNNSNMFPYYKTMM